MYQEQINILDMILSIDESNKTAIAEKKVAYSKLGKDQTQVDKDRWELDKSNVQFGLDYAQGLNAKEEYEKAIDVCNELLVYEPNNKRLLKIIANSYINIYEEAKALEYLEKLAEIDINNAEIMIEISELCVNLSLFQKAYIWANKAISTEKIISKAYFQRAEVLASTAEYNIGDDLDFCDRLVYDLALEDYGSSYENGNFNAKLYMNQLEDFISTKGDWFLSADGADKVSPSDKKCKKLKQSDCYDWITRKVNSKR
jgi:tetratricopeptide (TPR) repeat protein